MYGNTVTSKPEWRQGKILELLYEQGSVETKDLAQRFNVSQFTIRRDLTTLANQNKIKRHHGGAAPLGESYLSNLQRKYSRSSTCSTSAHKKNLLVKQFLPHLFPNSRIFIDSSFIAKHLVKSLPRETFTLFTNDASIYPIIKERNNIRLFYLGGSITSSPKETNDINFYTDGLVNNIDFAIIEPDYVDENGVILTKSMQKASILKMALNNSQHRFLVIPREVKSNKAIFKVSTLDEMTLIFKV